MTTRRFRVFFSVGEPSGDLHAANLIRAMRERCEGLEAVGYGGPQMAAAGAVLHADLTELAVMWFARALAHLPRFWDLASRADRYFRHHRPDAVVLVDYPGFNWWIAWRAKQHGIPVYYFTPPQIWAWAQWRVKKMRRYVDHVLCSLPFEEEWFRSHGCRATYVGHPFFDEVRRRQLDAEFLAQQRQRGGRLVTLLPGSRTQEVAANLPWLLKAAGKIRQAVPDVRFAVAAFKESQAERCRQWTVDSGRWAVGGTAGLPSSGEPALLDEPVVAPIDVYVGRTPELMHLAECCIACSGSVSLELLWHAKPTVILYWISRLAYAVQQRFRRVKYITLVNLLATDELFPKDLTPYDPSQPGAERVPFPEYLTYEDKSDAIAGHVIEWLLRPESRTARVAELERLRSAVGEGGAAARAAEIILKAEGGRGKAEGVGSGQ